MAAAANTGSTFSLFSNFSTEIRDQIWREALPGDIGPAFFLHKKGLWLPRRRGPSDKGYRPDNDAYNLDFSFRHDLLDALPFEIPLAFVNHEARDIAMTWVQKQGIEIRPRKDKQHPVFEHAFDLKRDALYVPADKWEGFIAEPCNRPYEDDLIEQSMNVESSIRCIAVPEALLRTFSFEGDYLPDVLNDFFNLEVLLIVFGAQPDLPETEKDLRVQQWWEFESIPGVTFPWDLVDGFDLGSLKNIGNETLEDWILGVADSFNAGLKYHRFRSFEIRPVHAVRRGFKPLGI